jgi:hypothetical protein
MGVGASNGIPKKEIKGPAKPDYGCTRTEFTTVRLCPRIYSAVFKGVRTIAGLNEQGAWYLGPVKSPIIAFEAGYIRSMQVFNHSLLLILV